MNANLWPCYLRRLEPSLLSRQARRFLQRLQRRLADVNNRCVTLAPPGKPRGHVLFSYIIDPFLLEPGRPLPHSHTHYWESLQMARTFLEQGYAVDVIHWSRKKPFVPGKKYDFYVDVRRNFEHIAPLLNKDCVKIVHLDTAHHKVFHEGQRRRLEELKERRGIDLAPFKLVEINRAIEMADYATILGNEYTIGTYAFANKPIVRIPISTPVDYPFPADKDFDGCRKHFIWFGSEGFVHKGLDLVLEAFAGMPDYRLTVFGPIDREIRFEAAFYRELFKTPNIRTPGWVDIAGREFIDTANRALGLVYASSSEGGGGGVITCMHAGLIPVVSRETSVDVAPDYGIILPDCSVITIQDQVRKLSARPADELRKMAMKAWEFARQHHTREHFAKAYREFVERIIRERETNK